MDYKLYIAIFLGIISSISSLIYIIDTLKGKTKPNRITYLFWGLPVLAAIASNSIEFSPASIPVFMAGIMPLIIFAISFLNKNSYWKLNKRDYICGVFAAISLYFWFVAKSPNATIFFSILADFLATIPTLIKCYKHPETETRITYFIHLLVDLINLYCISTWTFAGCAFQLYLCVMCVLLVVILYRKNKLTS